MGTQWGRCSIERGRDGDATVTGRSRSRHKNVRIAVKEFRLKLHAILTENLNISVKIACNFSKGAK
jgi:hypothetical protein